MDAINFIKTYQRMCLAHDGIECKNENGETCPLKSFTCDFIETPKEEMETIASKVEEWGKIHPARTKASDLKKVFPNVVCFEDGTPDICCASFNGGMCPGKNKPCQECKVKFWNTEIEED